MFLLLVTALAAATISAIATACVVYVLISFRRSGRLMAARLGRQPLMLVLVTDKRSPQARSNARPARRQPALRPATAH